MAKSLSSSHASTQPPPSSPHPSTVLWVGVATGRFEALDTVSRKGVSLVSKGHFRGPQQNAIPVQTGFCMPPVSSPIVSRSFDFVSHSEGFSIGLLQEDHCARSSCVGEVLPLNNFKAMQSVGLPACTRCGRYLPHSIILGLSLVA